MFSNLPIGKTSKAELAGCIANLCREEVIAKQDVFKPVELASLEVGLKDSFVKFPWLQTLLDKVILDGTIVSEEHVACYEKAKAANPGDAVELRNERKGLESTVMLLNKQKTRLDKKAAVKVERGIVDEKCLASLASSLRSEIDEIIEHLFLSQEKEQMHNQSKLIIQEIQLALSKLSETFPDDLFDEKATDLGLECSTTEEAKSIAQALERTNLRKLNTYVDQLSRVRKDLSETKSFFERRDNVWKKELGHLLHEINAGHISRTDTVPMKVDQLAKEAMSCKIIQLETEDQLDLDANELKKLFETANRTLNKRN
jgi:hypothetical protein